jgi:hypothetical protein
MFRRCGDDSWVAEGLIERSCYGRAGIRHDGNAQKLVRQALSEGIRRTTAWRFASVHQREGERQKGDRGESGRDGM